MGQRIRFCTAPDGVRIAFAVHGTGPPIVRTSTWLTHLEFDWVEALISIVRVGWDRPSPAFRRAFTTMFVPDATPEQMAWFDEMQRRSTSGATASRTSPSSSAT